MDRATLRWLLITDIKYSQHIYRTRDVILKRNPSARPLKFQQIKRNSKGYRWSKLKSVRLMLHKHITLWLDGYYTTVVVFLRTFHVDLLSDPNGFARFAFSVNIQCTHWEMYNVRGCEHLLRTAMEAACGPTVRFTVLRIDLPAQTGTKRDLQEWSRHRRGLYHCIVHRASLAFDTRQGRNTEVRSLLQPPGSARRSRLHVKCSRPQLASAAQGFF
jgi:hypothetical protein